jgi:hypothetical protein
MEDGMGVKDAPTAKGREAAASLKKAAAKDEKKTERAMGKDLAKGAQRVEERSKSSDGRGAGAKQKG